MIRRWLPFAIALLLMVFVTPKTNEAAYFEDLGTDPELLYFIWSTLVYDTDRFSIPIVEHIEIMVYDAGLRGREEVLESEEVFRRFLESEGSARLRENMRFTTRMEMALLIARIFRAPEVVRRAKLYPSYVRKVRALMLEFKDEFSRFDSAYVKEIEGLWNVGILPQDEVPLEK